MELKTTETATIRQSDGISYLEYDTFMTHYAFDKENKLGKGVSGAVYLSGTENAVKVFEEDDRLVDFVVELDIYAAAVHECILKPLAWTINGKVAYLAMRRGKSIVKAVADKDITLLKIMFDTLSAISYLNGKGVIHGDIKPDNMVYYGGQCQIIDMALGRRADFNKDGVYYFHEGAYTPRYRDPEYVSEQYNNANAEIYALAASYMELVEGKEPKYGEVSFYKGKEMKWFFDQAGQFQSTRPGIDYFLKEMVRRCKFPVHIGTVLLSPIQVTYAAEEMTIKGQYVQELVWLVKMGHVLDYKVETLFLGLDLFHRSYREVKTMYANFPDVLTIFSCIVLNLAATVSSGESVADAKTWKKYLKDKRTNFASLFQEMFIRVLAINRGIVSTLTPWNYAKTKHDLLSLLADSISPSYDTYRIRLTGEPNQNKCIKIRELLSETDIKQLQRGKWAPPTGSRLIARERMEIGQCELDLDTSGDIASEWEEITSSPVNETAILKFVAIFVRGRAELKDLDPDIAREIFLYLCEQRTKYPYLEVVLDRVCRPGWRDHITNTEDINPFL